MKKPILLILTFISIGLVGHVNANALSITILDPPVIDFGDMNMGDYVYDIPTFGLRVLCEATPTWTLDIRFDGELINSQGSTIPKTNFEWYVDSTDGVGTVNFGLGAGSSEDFTIEKRVYTSGAAETQATITMRFLLTLPDPQQAGTYTTNQNIVFTLTEP